MANEPASEQVRNFAAFHHSAVLSTLDATGAPFGSVVNYVLSPAGHDLSPTRNLLRDPRASLLIAEFFFIRRSAGGGAGECARTV